MVKLRAEMLRGDGADRLQPRVACVSNSSTSTRPGRDLRLEWDFYGAGDMISTGRCIVASLEVLLARNALRGRCFGIPPHELEPKQQQSQTPCG